jgi:hypothetical protein
VEHDVDRDHLTTEPRRVEHVADQLLSVILFARGVVERLDATIGT